MDEDVPRHRRNDALRPSLPRSRMLANTYSPELFVWRLFVSAGLSPPHDERKARVLRVWWGVSSAVTGDVCKCGDARAALCVQCGRWM